MLSVASPTILPLNLALISDAVAQADQLRLAAATDTIAIVYHADTMTTSGLVDLVKSVCAAHGGASIEHLGIVTHGSPGEIDIGSTDHLSLGTLPSHAAELQQLQFMFTENARVDLWSCSVAAGPQGKSFVNELAADTGAIVFASDNPVGTVSGADFVWEYHAGHMVAHGDLFSDQDIEAIPRLELATVTVTSPNGGENWLTNTSYAVNWTISGDTSALSYQYVALSTDGGATYTTLSSPLSASTRTFAFAPTSSQVSTSAMIRVRAMDSAGYIQAVDTSNSTFTISNPVVVPTVTVTSPNGGENWLTNTSYAVNWTISGDTSALSYQYVALSTDGGATYTTLSSPLSASTRTFAFAPTSSQVSTSAMIRVRAMDSAGYIQAVDTSNSTFTISNPVVVPTVTVTSPNGGENWSLGVAQTITWNFAGDTSQLNNFLVSYSLDGGATYVNDVGTASSTDRSISWTPPLVIAAGTLGKIRVEARNASNSVLTQDYSDGTFTLVTGGSIVAGFDRLYFPAHADTMADLIQRTNLRWCGYYLDAPSQRMNTGWLGERSYLQALGWQLAPIYVGQQAPGYSSSDSCNPSWQQGITDGTEAVAEMGPDTGATQQVYDSGTATWITVPTGQGFAPGTIVYLDWESGDISAGPETDYIVAWCETVSDAGYRPGVYCHLSQVSIIAAQLALPAYQITAQFWVAYPTNPSISSSTTQFPTTDYDPTQAQASATSWQYAMSGIYGDVYGIQTINGLLSPVDLDTSSLYGSSPSQPEVSVTGNGQNITDGDATPGTADWTDFGSVAQGGGAITRTFTVRNTGTAALTLGSVSVPSGFTVTDDLAMSLIVGGSTTFSVRMDTASAGTMSGQISFSTDDSDENPFNFSITGTVTVPTAPEIVVDGNGQNIADGDTTPSLSDWTDFGSVVQGGSAVTRTFTVRNTGTAALTLGSVSVPSGFTVTDDLAMSLIAGGSTTFSVRMDTASAGTKSGQISFSTDDSDENPFNFSITGTVTVTPTRIISLSGNLAFGDVTVGSSAQSSLIIYNTGNSALTVSGISYPSGFSGNWSGSIAAGGSHSVTVTFSPTSATTYGGTVTVNSDQTNSGSNTINASGMGTVIPVGPVNDNFANRTLITGTLASIMATNVEATKEPGEPNHADTSGGKSVWWTWTTPWTGSVLVDTMGSDFDTTLAIYTGNSISTLTTVASDDDSGGNGSSLLTFTAVGGTSYQIAVDGYNGASGNISLFVDLINQRPSVAVVTPSGTQSGNATISYTLTDAESDPCSIQVQYSGDGGSTWNDATSGSDGDGLTGLASSPNGTSHTFVWASSADIANRNNFNVEIRVTPSDAGGTGTAGTTGIFAVNNVLYWPSSVVVQPSNPGSTDTVSITLFGNWPDIAVPRELAGYPTVQCIGSDIYFNTYRYVGVIMPVPTQWSVTATVGPLAPGEYHVLASLYGWATPSSGVWLDKGPDLVTAFTVVDATPPTVTLTVPALTNTSTPSGTVTVADIGSGVPDGTIVYLDVDTNNDGDFTDALDILGYAEGPLLGGQWNFTTSSAIMDGTYGLRARASDAAWNEGTSAESTIVIDTTSPTVVINQAMTQADPTNASPINFTVVFSEAVTCFDANGITLGGTAGPTTATVTGSGTTYNVAVSGMTSDGTVIASIAAGVAQDAAGNANTASTSTDNTVSYDITAPMVTISDPSKTVTTSNSVTYTVAYADANFNASTLSTSDITLNKTGTANGTVSALGSGTWYIVTISGITGNGTLGLSLAAGTASDLAGNLAPAAGPSATFLVDNTAPTVTINQATTQADPTNASMINFTVIFSEMVTDFATGDVTLSGTAPGALVGTVTGSGTTYNVAVSGMTGSGTVIASIGAGVAHDAAGNTNVVAISSDNNVTYHLQDTTAPTVAISSPYNAQRFTTSSITVSGMAYDSGGSGLDYVIVLNNTTGEGGWATGLSGNSSAYSVSGIGLVAGNNEIYAVAYDKQGNQSNLVAAHIGVAYDAGPTIFNVVVTARTSADKTTITWSESDSNGFGKGKTTLTIDGKAVTISKKAVGKTAANFSYSGKLTAGTHAFTVNAANAKGETSSFSDTFTVAPTTPVILSVKTKTTTSDKNSTISWKVTDIDGVGAVTLTVDGVVVTSGIKVSGKSTSRSYTYSGLLPAGKHDYVINAKDAAPDPATATPYPGTFTVKATVPVISKVKVAVGTSATPTTIIWRVYDYDGIGSATLKIDSIAVTSGIAQVVNPDGSVTYTYAGVQTAGKHTFTIDAIDAVVPPASAKQVKGSFTVKAPKNAVRLATANVAGTVKTDWLIDHTLAASSAISTDSLDAVFAAY